MIYYGSPEKVTYQDGKGTAKSKIKNISQDRAALAAARINQRFLMTNLGVSVTRAYVRSLCLVSCIRNQLIVLGVSINHVSALLPK